MMYNLLLYMYMQRIT